MPRFCVACGAPLSGPAEFCGKCGARAGQAPFVGTTAAAKPAGGSALKIVLIVVGVSFVFGVLAVGGIYYTARSYVKLAEKVTGLNAGDVVSSIRDAANHTADGASGRKAKGVAVARTMLTRL